ncbi:MAG: class I SAM-dependent methyltransferase [Candidatus Thorarchaeota archaeon]|jgi:O-methyltransferase involved in polyketide biosynthesis
MEDTGYLRTDAELTNAEGIDTATIQSTMVGPLWARATFSQRYPHILEDQEAADVFAKVVKKHPEAKDEFVVMEQLIDEFLGLFFLVRARVFDDAVRNYLVGNPEASVVNLGCGLDTTFSRVDNGRLLWYDLDLPDAIDYRKSIIPETPRSKCIPKSIFDLSWFDDIDFVPNRGAFFIAGGLFSYFSEDSLISLCNSMAWQFPGAELIFDAGSKVGNMFVNRRFRKYGIKGIKQQFDLGNPTKQLSKWSDRIEVVEGFTHFDRTQREQTWKWETRTMMNLCDWFNLSKFAHLRFSDE